MKRYLTVLFAGAMLASAAFPANGDPFQAERFKAKTGRYPVKSTVAAQECTSGCCRRPQMAKVQKAPAPSDSQFFFEAWSQAKWGRSLRRSDERAAGQVAQAQTASSRAAQCCPSNCCD